MQSPLPRRRRGLPEGFGVYVSSADGETFWVTRNKSQPAHDFIPRGEHETVPGSSR